jgi:O-acetyl-ADP-ribose deacetylase (regulator of RNase III)
VETRVGGRTAPSVFPPCEPATSATLTAVPATFIKGDIFETEGLRAFAHGCNCAGTMDAGVSIAFKKRWPAMFEEYKARCTDGRLHLGDVLVWTGGDVTVFCLALQEHWKKKAKLPALARSLRKMVQLATSAGIERVGLPRVGAGLGGLDWPRAKSILTEVGGETPLDLVVFEQFVRGAGA